MLFSLGMDATSKGGSQLLETLEQLLEIRATSLDAAMDEASAPLADALRCDKVDVFVLDAASSTLVARGTSSTPLSRRQRALGLDRRAIANGGSTADCFTTVRPSLIGRADLLPDEPPGVIRELGIRSLVSAPLEVDGVCRGVVQAASQKPDFFCDGDLKFLVAVSHWVGQVAYRAELVERLTDNAARVGRHAAAEELITILAHDLRNHLQPLKGRVEILRKRALREHRPSDLADSTAATRSLDRFERLIADLLDVARLDHGAYAVAPQPLNLAALVREAAQPLSGTKTTIQVRAPEETTVMADPERLRQALDNLLANAVKHSPAGVPVVVEVETIDGEKGLRACVAVTNQGPGVAAEVMPHLFDRFVTGPGSNGLGLGLYLARRIATAHGGDLTVHSEPGKGARFELALPAGRTNG